MFWRKKRPSSELFTYETRCRRTSFRYFPPDDEPVIAEVEGRPVCLRDIGAGGVSFEDPSFHAEQALHIRFRFPSQDRDISAGLKVVDIDEMGVCHCRFDKIRDRDVETIHRYLLEKQKEAARRQRTFAAESSEAARAGEAEV